VPSGVHSMTTRLSAAASLSLACDLACVEYGRVTWLSKCTAVDCLIMTTCLPVVAVSDEGGCGWMHNAAHSVWNMYVECTLHSDTNDVRARFFTQSLTEVDADGWTALHFACVAGHEEAARLILEAAARHGCVRQVLDAETRYSSSPITFAGTCAAFIGAVPKYRPSDWWKGRLGWERASCVRRGLMPFTHSAPFLSRCSAVLPHRVGAAAAAVRRGCDTSVGLQPAHPAHAGCAVGVHRAGAAAARRW
jgi:hypothetical protein